MKRIFTPFFRGDRSRARQTGGLGLGLLLARRILEAHRHGGADPRAARFMKPHPQVAARPIILLEAMRPRVALPVSFAETPPGCMALRRHAESETRRRITSREVRDTGRRIRRVVCFLMRRREGHSPRRLSARVSPRRHNAHRAPHWSVTFAVAVRFLSEDSVGENAPVPGAGEPFACSGFATQINAERGEDQRTGRPRADSRRGEWPSRRRIRKHTTRCPRRPVSPASSEVPRRRARFLRGGAGPCSPAASQRSIQPAQWGAFTLDPPSPYH
jgi:hypothetical protein